MSELCGLNESLQVQGQVMYGCESEETTQHWLTEVMRLDTGKIFVSAEELSGSVAMTASGDAIAIPAAEHVNGGWVCSQNSTVNPHRSEMADLVENFACPSGETLMFYGCAIESQNYLYGYGENVPRSVVLKSNV